MSDHELYEQVRAIDHHTETLLRGQRGKVIQLELEFALGIVAFDL
jgi:hypothetical protein